jgi:hypothetical protein
MFEATITFIRAGHLFTYTAKFATFAEVRRRVKEIEATTDLVSYSAVTDNGRIIPLDL